MHEIVARALPAWDAAMRDYGFVLGCHEARRLLDERLIGRPRNAWGWQHRASAMDHLGDDAAAALGRDRTKDIRELA